MSILSDGTYMLMLHAGCHLLPLQEACIVTVVKSYISSAESVVAEYELNWSKLVVCSRSITHIWYIHCMRLCTYKHLLSNCIHACTCTFHLDTHKKYLSVSPLTKAIIITCLTRGFSRTWGEMTGSESCFDGYDKVLAVCVLTTSYLSCLFFIALFPRVALVQLGVF